MSSMKNIKPTPMSIWSRIKKKRKKKRNKKRNKKRKERNKSLLNWSSKSANKVSQRAALLKNYNKNQ